MLDSYLGYICYIINRHSAVVGPLITKNICNGFTYLIARSCRVRCWPGTNSWFSFKVMSLGPRAWPPIATLNFCDRMDIDGSRPGVFKYLLMQFSVLLTHCTSYACWCNAWSAIAYDCSISEQLVKLNKLQQLLLHLPISKLKLYHCYAVLEHNILIRSDETSVSGRVPTYRLESQGSIPGSCRDFSFAELPYIQWAPEAAGAESLLLASIKRRG
jgi:hypothetical protein